MPAGTKASRKRFYIGIGTGLALLVAAVAAGLATLKGASSEVDASRLAVAERGTMVRSVVATGKIEPITKIEIKSKANGIIKVLPIEVDQQVEEGAILVELDRDNLTAQV